MNVIYMFFHLFFFFYPIAHRYSIAWAVDYVEEMQSRKSIYKAFDFLDKVEEIKKKNKEIISNFIETLDMDGI